MTTNDPTLQVAERIDGFLREALGSAFSRVGDTTFFAKRGSTVVGISVQAWGEDDAMVHVEAPVVQGAELSLDLLRQLLEFNHGSTYGAFGVKEDGLITCHHCLLGSTLDPAAFVPAVLEVAKIADDWDDVIIDQAGGKTAVAMLTKQKPTIEAPTIQQPAAPAE